MSEAGTLNIPNGLKAVTNGVHNELETSATEIPASTLRVRSL